MKTMQPVNAEGRHFEADLEARIKALFGRCPDLTGFSLQDRGGLPDHIDPSGREGELFILEVDFSMPISEDEFEEVYDMLNITISELVSERPGAFEWLCGRTFARTLH